MFIDFLPEIFIFTFGLCIGSFLNVVICRIEKEEGFVKGRSYCPHCKHTLSWADLVPVFSFIFLGGKCRYCHKKISVQYPLVEMLTGLVFLLIFNLSYPGVLFTDAFSILSGLNLLFLLYVFSSLIIIFIYDLKYFLIPDQVLFPAIIVAFLYRLLQTGTIWNFVFAVLLASGFFLSIFLISKGKWMGFGDVKLAILLGLLLGFPNILTGLFLSFAFGAIIGIILILLSKNGLKSEVPFAPFLIAGTFAAMFFGDIIIQWYAHILLF